jgi:hypothetical protein
MAVLGALALKAWRDHQAQQGGAAPSVEPTQDEVAALTGPDTERLVLRAMIGAAQVDGHVDEAEMEKILGRMHEDEVTDEERRAAREEVRRPVDVEDLGAHVSRPEGRDGGLSRGAYGCGHRHGVGARLLSPPGESVAPRHGGGLAPAPDDGRSERRVLLCLSRDG